MRKLILIMIMLPVFAFADTPLFKEFVKIKNFSADFEQENSYHGLDSFSLKGKVYVIRADKAIWDYTDPVEYFLMTKDSIEHYNEELNQLTRMKVNPTEINDPNSLLLSIFLDSNSMENKFNITEEGNVVTLVPKNLPELKKIILTFENKKISSVFTEDTSGNKINIKFSNISEKKISSDVFKKSTPKDVNIVEQ